jgi:hypothetical protein
MSKQIIIFITFVILILFMSTVFYFYSKASASASLENMQKKIDELITGKLSIENLKVRGSLNISSSNPDDMFPLKLITKAKKNVISFRRYQVPFNEFGLMSSDKTSKKKYKLSSPLPLKERPKGLGTLSIDFIQEQIDNILSGKTPLNNLKVKGSLTVNSGGRVKAVEGYKDKYSLNGGLSLVNKDANKNSLDSAILFGSDGEAKGYYGLSKIYKDSSNKLFYDRYSTNVKYKNENWDSRSILPACEPSALISAGSNKTKDIGSLERQLNDILNGTSQFTNLVVNGDVTVISELESPLILNVESCDPTIMVGFNNLDARGTNGYGGPFDWFGSYFDLSGTISAGKLVE